jgi:hypothetical protein
VKAAVTSGDQSLTSEMAAAIKDALEKIFQVSWLLEDPHFPAQPGCARLLIEVGASVY